MKDETYRALLRDLQRLQKVLVTSQVEAVRRDPILTARLARLHSEAEVGGHIDTFVATAARRSTVLFLLRSVFVRVLEDLGILGLKRIRDDWGFAAFREVAPSLGLQSYFGFVFRDLAVDFPALFSPSDDELPLPNEDGCRALWNLWHHPNREGEHYVWNGDGFDSRFLGDLYEALDSDIRKRYALRQTPRFVEQFILDRTLVPALADFDPHQLAQAGDTFRVLDPTCGSGHFLIGAFHRLADYWHKQQKLSEWSACEKALESVWGCDINQHAIEIAAFRVLLEVVARTGVKDLGDLAALKLNLRTMDSLIPWERRDKQRELFGARDRLDAYATPTQRADNAAFLGARFHAVVGNPPYISPADDAKKADYRVFWPNSARGKYALSAPFVERFFSLGTTGAAIGMINSNNFVTDDFGRGVIELALKTFQIDLVVDTQFAAIPGHGMKGGTATLMLFGRSNLPRHDNVKWLLSKRGEPARSGEQGTGMVWASILGAAASPTYEDEYISVEYSEQGKLHKHPWVLGGGLTSDILLAMSASNPPLTATGCKFGYLTKPVEDDIYVPAPPWLVRRYPDLVVPMVEGGKIRDWNIAEPDLCLHPHDAATGVPLALNDNDALYRYFWTFRSTLWQRKSRASGFGPLRSIPKAKFFEFPFYYNQGLSEHFICTPYKYTINHFAIARPPKLFKQTVRALRLFGEERFDILALLNSSSVGFWIRSKSGGMGQSRELWMDRRDVNQSVLEAIPFVPLGVEAAALARALDDAAQARHACLPGAIIRSTGWSPATLHGLVEEGRERYLTWTYRMVALQEELDWYTYGAYGLIEPIPTARVNDVEPLKPGHRPFEIVLARAEDDTGAEEKSVWWSRLGHVRVSEVPESYSDAHRARLRQRVNLIESNPRLAVLETPPNKRRWQLVDWAVESKKAAETWLLDRLEELFLPSRETGGAGPLAEPRPYRLEEIVAAWSRDPHVAAVAGLWTGTRASVDLSLVAEELLLGSALPDNPYRVYTKEGLRTFAEWKEVWALQDQEDEWERAALRERERGERQPQKRLTYSDGRSLNTNEVPAAPKFEKTHFVRPEFFAIRGKLNVPQERFVLFANLKPPRFGWNGWRQRERALAQVGAFTLAEADPERPLPLPTPEDPRRCGVTLGLWESLPDVRRWGAVGEHAELHALAREACRQSRCPCPVVENWQAQALSGKAALEEPQKAKRKLPLAPTVSIAQRAWVASLFPVDRELDLDGVWARHVARLSGPIQPTLPGVGGAPVQLTMAMPSDAIAGEQASLDQTQLALALDDLVASGDLQSSGRGKKKRFQLIVRGGAS